jgi:hypothetical protein
VMWFVRWKGRSDGCDGSDGDAMEGIVFGVLFCFVFFLVFLSCFLSQFLTFRSKVLMKGGGYVTGG